MASNLYPQGITLHSLGYAALKYPNLPPELPVPLNNQLGVLARSPLSTQIRIMAQVASQYLPSLLEYQYSDAPHLHDASHAEYYFFGALNLVNWLCNQPDVATKVAEHPQLTHDIVEKLLVPDVEEKMKGCERIWGATFDTDFGFMLQFLSTMLLFSTKSLTEVHPRINDLVPKLKKWKKTYRNSPVKTISKASDRLVDQIEGLNTGEADLVKVTLVNHLVCGYLACHVQGDASMKKCGQCALTRYCSVEHQRKDWKNHKHICNKGLVEEEPEAN